jgi:hypothetical protein
MDKLISVSPPSGFVCATKAPEVERDKDGRIVQVTVHVVQMGQARGALRWLNREDPTKW